MGVQFPGKKRYVTLEWPLRSMSAAVDVGRLVIDMLLTSL